MTQPLLRAAFCVLASLALAAAPPPDDVDEQAHFIDGLYERGLYDMAADEAAEFLEEHSRHERAEVVRYRLAGALFELNRLDEAAPHFRTLSQRRDFRYRAEACLRLGQCEMEAGNFDDAAAALRRAMELDASYLRAPVTFLLGEAEFRRGNFDDAARRYKEVLKLDAPGDFATDAQTGLAWCAFRTGDFDEAAQRVDNLLKTRPNAELASELRFLQGEIHLEQGGPREALLAYSAVTTGPFQDAALRGRGFAHAELGNHEGACDAFEALLTRYPSSRFVPEASLHLGIHRLQAGDAEGASTALSSPALPADASTFYWRARTRSELGDDAGALALLDRAAQLNPDPEMSAHIHGARGDLLTRTGRADEAARAYQSAGSDQALHAAAVAQLNAGDATGALKLADGLVDRNERDPDIQLTRGEALFLLERYQEAEPAFTVAAQHGEGATQSRAMSRLAWCRYLVGDARGASQRFARLVRDLPDAPESVEGLYMLGLTQKEAGDEAGAQQSWSKYLQQHRSGPHRAEVRVGLAALGGTAESLVQLRAVLDEHGDSPLVPQALYDYAEASAQSGKSRAAEDRYRELIERFPGHPLVPQARYGLAWSLSERGEHREAVASLDELLGADTARARGRESDLDADLRTAALELLVWCHHELGKPDAAEQAWRAMSQLDVEPQRLLDAARSVAAAWTAAGESQRAVAFLDGLASRSGGASAESLVEATWIALDAGDVAQADQRIRRALQQSPDAREVAEACFFVAEAHFEREHDEAAIPLYAAAARAGDSPFPDQALYKQGFALLRSEKPAEAEECFARLARDHFDSVLYGESLFLAGEAAFRAENWERCTHWMSNLLREHPRHEVVPKARFRYGVALAKLERWNEAQSVLGDLARSSPSFENILEAELWRGRALATLGNERTAAAALERVVSSDKGVLAARARIELGRLQLRAGATEEALSEFLKVAVLYSHSDEVAQALLLAGQCLESLGDLDRARDRYREIVSKHPQTTYAQEAQKRLSTL